MVGVQSVIQTIFSIAACVIAVCIAVWIMHNQRYENLLQNYLSTDFVAAIKGVVDFFKDDCNSDVNQIADAYKKRFEEDFKKSNKETNDKSDCTKEASQILHFQRSMLNNFFWGLSSCTKRNPFLRHKLKNEFTRNEAYICKILIHMNLAVDSNPEFFTDVSDIKYEPMPKTKGMNNSLKNVYEILKKQKRWIK